METKEAALEGNIRTVGCSVSKLILNEDHLQSIRDVVLSTHKATILVSELLNIHIRRMLEEDPESDLQCCFHPNWLSQAYNGVTKAKMPSTPKIDECLQETLQFHMPSFSIPPRFCSIPSSEIEDTKNRTGTTTQCLKYEAINMATVAKNNIYGCISGSDCRRMCVWFVDSTKRLTSC